MPAILVVEDDKHSRRINCTALGSAGFEIHEADNGTDGIRLALELVPDLIVMDLALPGTGGIDAIARIKQAMGEAAPLILVLSAHAMKDDLDMARRAGCDVYLAKPIDPFDLVHEVHRLLSSRGAGT